MDSIIFFTDRDEVAGSDQVFLGLVYFPEFRVLSSSSNFTKVTFNPLILTYCITYTLDSCNICDSAAVIKFSWILSIFMNLGCSALAQILLR